MIFREVQNIDKTDDERIQKKKDMEDNAALR